MTQETLGFVKLEWTCPKCGSRNPGPEKTCRNCGAPQPENVAFEQAAGETARQDEALKKIVAKGPDIHCPFCGTRNAADADVCSQCGGDLKSGVRRESGKVVGAYQVAAEKQIACPNCHVENPESSLICKQCGAPLKRESVPQAAPISAPARKGIPQNFIAIGVFVGLALLCVIGIAAYIMLSSPRESKLASVAQVEWQARVPVEELGPVQHQDWQNEIPQEAEIGQCQDRVFQVLNTQPPVGNFNKICGTPYTIDTGSGVGQVVQDCQFEVLKPYCDYVVEEWRVVDEVSQAGRDLNPVLPKPQLDSDQRLGQGSISAIVVFESGDNEYTYRVSDLNEFQQFAVGSHWQLKLNALGQIVSVEPAP